MDSAICPCCDTPLRPPSVMVGRDATPEWEPPSAGDFGLCGRCGGLHVYVDNRVVRLPTVAEAMIALDDPAIRKAVFATAERVIQQRAERQRMH